MPDDSLIVQGEIIGNAEDGLVEWSSLYLRYSITKKPMLEVLAEDSCYVCGLIAKLILEKAL